MSTLDFTAGSDGIFRQYEPGKKITEPGAYLNVPMEVYHGQPTDGPSVSSSGLRTLFIDSPKHYWLGSHFNPEREDIEQTEAIVLGRAAHHLMLGEGDFSKFFAIRPETLDGEKWNGNRTACKKWLGEQALNGLTVLTPGQVEQIKGMSRSLAAEPIIQGGILNGAIEVSLFWKDPETGIWLKSRPDAIPNSSGDYSDLKCVADVSDDGISRSLGERGYHQQGALVGEASREVLKMEMEHFTLVYVEQKKPHCVRFDEIAPEEIRQGALENRAALRLLRRCIDTGYWPGPKSIAGDGGYVRRPSWSQKRAAERVAAIEMELAR